MRLSEVQVKVLRRLVVGDIISKKEYRVAGYIRSSEHGGLYVHASTMRMLREHRLIEVTGYTGEGIFSRTEWTISEVGRKALEVHDA